MGLEGFGSAATLNVQRARELGTRIGDLGFRV